MTDLAAEPAASKRIPSRVLALTKALRPRQWIKNLACLAGVIFSGRLTSLSAVLEAASAVGGFCLAASAVYLFNDLCDRAHDREHPVKRRRPIASGALPATWAMSACALLAGSALVVGALLGLRCFVVIAAYLVMGTAYSTRLKHAPILDVFVIALGFVLRVLFGVYAVRVEPSSWIILCMFFLALFLGFAKRRAELGHAEFSELARPALAGYTLALLDQLLAMTGTMAILSYAIYAVTGRADGVNLLATVPFVAYGVLRQMHRVVTAGAGASFEREVVGDPHTLGTVLAWVGVCVWILYVTPAL